MLEFSLMLRDKIEKSGKYRVAMTRSDDSFVALAERVQLARARQARRCSSRSMPMRCARGDDDVRGATVYTLSDNASDAEAARLAEAENRADAIAGVDLSAEPGDVADILIDLARRETNNFSLHFARTVVSSSRTPRGCTSIRSSRPASGARAPDVPSVLIELGYVSNKADLKPLMSEAWRGRATARHRPGGPRFLRHPPCRPTGPVALERAGEP